MPGVLMIEALAQTGCEISATNAGIRVARNGAESERVAARKQFLRDVKMNIGDTVADRDHRARAPHQRE